MEKDTSRGEEKSETLDDSVEKIEEELKYVEEIKTRNEEGKLVEFSKEEESKVYLIECCICLEKTGIIGIIINCQHKFCRECINHWAEIENTCPLCKSRFTQIFYKNHFAIHDGHINKREDQHMQIDERNQVPQYQNFSFITQASSWRQLRVRRDLRRLRNKIKRKFTQSNSLSFPSNEFNSELFSF